MERSRGGRQSMTVSRRSFVSRSSLLLAGTALLPGVSLSALGALGSRVAVPLSASDLAVITWVRTYASDLRIVGGGVLGKLRNSANSKTHILAKVVDLATL